MKIHDHVSSHHSFMYLWIVGALLVLGGLVYSYIGTHPAGIIDGSHEGDVRTTVAQFGNQLNTVSIGSPTASDDIRNAYASLVTPALLSQWEEYPLSAPGRVTSSPWPDHIEVDSVRMNALGAYDVEGRIMLMTSTGDAGVIPVSLTVTDTGGSFLISRYQENPGMPSEEGVVRPSETVVTRLREPVSSYGTAFTVTSLEEDSRCPADVQCIQAGTVRVQVSVSSDEGAPLFTLGLGESVLTSAARITLTEVTPSKVSTETISETAYRFTFLVEAR